MSEANEEGRESVVAVARAVKTRGLKGEIIAELLTDFPERFDGLNELIAIAPTGEESVVPIENHWFQKGRVVLKLEGFDNVEKAKQLIGYEFAVPESEIFDLPEDHYYDWQLEGCTVRLVTGVVVGQVKAIVKTGGAEILAIAGEQGNEYLVPLAAEIVVSIEPSTKQIVIDPPQGLLDL